MDDDLLKILSFSFRVHINICKNTGLGDMLGFPEPGNLIERLMSDITLIGIDVDENKLLV